MAKEIIHFTDAPEIQHFAMVKVNPNDNVYGVKWGTLVKDYLKTAYLSEEADSEVVSDGITYKVLRRREVTVFYDSDGDTLFDVKNTRLAKEYGLLTKAPKGADDEADISEPLTPMGKTIAGIEKEAFDEAVKTDTQQEDEKAGAVYASGGDKLRKEENKMLESVKPEYMEVMKSQMDLLFSQLIELAEKDTEFEKKVLLPHKSMERCMKYCSEKAMGLREPSDQEKDAARRNHVPIVTPVGETLLISWIMEYYNMDDKEEAEKEAKRKAKQQKTEKDRKPESKKGSTTGTAPEKKAEKEDKTQVKTEKKRVVEGKMENQLSLFDMGV